MTHSAFHFAFGIITASVFTTPPVVRRWQTGRTVGRSIAIWLGTSYMLGAYAVIPSIIDGVGVSQDFVNAWWMNIFLAHPLLNALLPAHCELLAPSVLFFLLAVQYAVILAAIRRATRSTLST